MTTTLPATFASLVTLLRPYQSQLICTHDSDNHYSLDTPFVLPNRKPLFFAGVKTGRAAVSLHCMPVYLYPDLLTGVPIDISKNLQGKSCFHFRQVSDAQLQALTQLLQKGWQRYRQAGYLS